MTTTKKALIYTRVSRDDSGEGRSNARQREDCQKLAELRGWEVVGVEEDISISAYGTKDRPAWNRVLDAVDAGDVDVVIAWHIDRMTRNMLDLERLILLSEQHGVGVATVTGDIDLTSDVGRMVARILAAVARAEVERKGARQRRANQQRAAEGLPWTSGWRALGYKLVGPKKQRRAVVVPEEAALIQEAAEDVLNGTSLHEVQRRWGALGVSTPRSAKGKTGMWTHSGVRSVLLNPRNAGIARHKGEVVGVGQWEPILSLETHTLLVAKLTDPARKVGGPDKFGLAENLLSGIAVCATCGETVAAGSGHKGKPIYQCKGYHTSTYREEADELVRSAFALSVQMTGPGRVVPLATTQTPDVLLAQAAQLQERLASLSTSFAAGKISIGQLEAASQSITAQLSDVEERIRQASESPRDPLTLRSEAVSDFLALDLAGQRRVLSELSEITLYPKGRGKKNVPIKHQVTMRVKGVGDRWFMALDERPTSEGDR